MASSNAGRIRAASPGLIMVLALSGCWGVYDAPPTTLRVDNETDERVIVTFPINGVDPTRYEVNAHAGRNLEVPEGCLGEEIVISTEAGDELEVVEQPACPGWTLILREGAEAEYRAP